VKNSEFNKCAAICTSVEVGNLLNHHQCAAYNLDDATAALLHQNTHQTPAYWWRGDRVMKPNSIFGNFLQQQPCLASVGKPVLADIVIWLLKSMKSNSN